MNANMKKENINANYSHRTSEASERFKSQNKNPIYQHRIKSGRPAFSSKKENINNGIINGEGSIEEKFNELKKENHNNHQMNSAKEIPTNINSNAKKDNNLNNNNNSYNQSFLNDYSLNIQVNNSMSKHINQQNEMTNHTDSIKEHDIEDTQRLLVKQKKNNFLKNNQSQDQKLQINNNGFNNLNNPPNINRGKIPQIKIRQRSNSPTILKMQGQSVINQNRIISANLHSKQNIANIQQIEYTDFKINGQNIKKKKDQEDLTITSCEDSITQNIQKDKNKSFQIISKHPQKLSKKKIERESSDAIISSNNSSDTEEINDDSIKDKRVQSISVTPGISKHNQYNLKESQNTFDVFETSSYTNPSEKRKSVESEHKLPRINRLHVKSKETALYNQLRESNQKNALELPSIIDNIKQNVNSCENLFKNRLKDKIGDFQGQFQGANQKQKDPEFDQYDFEYNQKNNNHEQFDKAIQKNQQQKGKEHIPASILNSKNINSQRQIDNINKKDNNHSIQPSTNRNSMKDDCLLKQESPNHIFKYIRQSQHSEQRESVNRRDSSISYLQQAPNTNQQSVQVRNRIKSEHNVMHNNSSNNYPSEKIITEDSEAEPNSTADRKKLKKLNQINKYLKNKMDMQKQIINQGNSNPNNNSNSNNNNNSIQNNNSINNGNIQNSNIKSQPHKQVQLQIQQQQLLQISKNQQIAYSNQKKQITQNSESSKEIINAQNIPSPSNDQSNSNKNSIQQKGVIEVLDQALFKRKEDKVQKSISQQIEKEMDKLNILTSKSSSARDEQLRIQEELIKYNLKVKLNKMKQVDTVLENLQEEYP